MTGYQSAVLWMGLMLIILRLFSTGEWHNLWSTISSGKPATSASSTQAKAPASGNSSAENLLKGYAGFLEHTGGSLV